MAKRFEMFYGPSGEGKSTAAIAVAKRIKQETGKHTRVYIGDGSRATYEDSGFVYDAEDNPAGFIHLFEFGTLPNPFRVSDQICELYWPNAKGQLVPPTPESLVNIGLVIYEGASVMGTYLMGDQKGGLRYRAGQGEKIGQDSPIFINDDGTKVGGNPPSHYNVAQGAMVTRIEKSKAFPGWVIWTAHERLDDGKSGAEQQREKLIGPEVVGKALTASISRVFHNTLHFTTVMSKKKVADPTTQKQVDVVHTEYRVYTRDHFDADGTNYTKYKAVSRCPKPELLPDYIVGEQPGDNIIRFYQILAEARQKVREELEQEAGAA